MKKVRYINTPDTPREVQKISNNENEKLSAEEHKKFRSEYILYFMGVLII